MTPRKMIESLSPAWQAFVALGGAIAFGFVVALALAGWVSLPSKVEAQGDAIVDVTSDVAMLKRKVDRIECVVVAQAVGADPRDRCGL